MAEQVAERVLPRIESVGCMRCRGGGATKWARRFGVLYPYHTHCLKLDEKAEMVVESDAKNDDSVFTGSLSLRGNVPMYMTNNEPLTLTEHPKFHPPMKCSTCGSKLIVTVWDDRYSKHEAKCLRCNRHWWKA